MNANANLVCADSAGKGLSTSTPANTAMGALGGSISNLQERLSILKDALGPVLAPPRPTPEKAEQEGSPIPLVDEICRQKHRVDSIVADVIDLIERLGV